MNLSERARKLNEAINQIGHIDGINQAGGLDEDQALLDLAENLLSQPPFQPGSQQERRLQARLARLALQASPQQAARHRRRYHFSTAMRVLGTVSLLVVFSMLVIFFFQHLLPQAATDTPQPLVLANMTPSAIAPIPEEIIPKNLAVVPDACTVNAPGTFLGEGLINTNIPKTFAGGGMVESGDFKFDLWLACDARYTSDLYPGSDDFSELNGLGLVVGYHYNGPKADGTLWDYAGFEPFVRQKSGASPVGSSMETYVEHGIQFSGEIVPDFSRQDTALRFVYFGQLPGGERYGATLSFVLQREADGYRPIDIQVRALSASELVNIENQDPSQLPFVTRSPIDQYPKIAAVREKLVAWQNSLIGQPGWVYVKTGVQSPHQGNTLYGGADAYTDESWYLLDEQSRAVASINQTTALDGSVLSQNVYQNGVGRDLTIGNTYENEPFALDFIGSLLIWLTSRARTGADFQLEEITWQGQNAWVFTNKDTFASPAKLDDQQEVIAVEGRDYVDPLTGAYLGHETYIFTAGGQEILSRRNINQVTERIEEPPAAIMALFSQEPKPYSPPAAVGNPPPLGFDPATAALRLRYNPGDDFKLPTYWVGDVYAGDYLLGRINFGWVPGGRCQRSSDGSRIAFLYDTQSNGENYSSEARWADLSDLETIFQPASQVDVHSITLFWSPVAPLFVFTGCLQDGSQCGLYLVDTTTNDVRFLSSAALSVWPIIWKPDGSQLALVDTTDREHRFYVISVDSGETIYEGIFDADKWQIPANSPAASWGVRIPRGSEEEGGCFK
ncbi:MAG: hypothetical protein BGO78_13055 [Chloroflexi bacterium 44-23]|nr:MAG: hypothetical protein BGO78_13055 [Chloroflexi bacterium 44-23]